MVNISAALLKAAQALKFAATGWVPLVVQDVNCPAQSAMQYNRIQLILVLINVNISVVQHRLIPKLGSNLDCLM